MLSEVIPSVDKIIFELDMALALSYCTKEVQEGIDLYSKGYRQKEVARKVGRDRNALFNDIRKVAKK